MTSVYRVNAELKYCWKITWKICPSICTLTEQDILVQYPTTEDQQTPR